MHNLPADAYPSPTAVPFAFGLPACRQVAVVLCGYRASASSQGIGAGSVLLRTLAAVWRGLTGELGRVHVRFYRDFYANPRDPAYMAARLDELTRHACPDAVIDVLAADDAILPDMIRQARSVETIAPSGLPEAAKSFLLNRPYDAVVLVQPDAIGLGQDVIETAVRRTGRGPVFVLTGRRRVYELTSAQERSLRWRRFLAETRLLEAVLARVLSLAALFCALRDARAESVRRR